MKNRIVVLCVLMLSALACDPVTNQKNSAKREFPPGISGEFIAQSYSSNVGMGRVLVMNALIQTTSGDTLLNSKTMRRGFRFTLDGKAANNQGLLFEALQAVSKGDSVLLKIPAQNLYDSTFRQPMPEKVTAADTLLLRIGVVSSLSLADHLRDQIAQFEKIRAKRSAEQDSMTVADGEKIDAYLKSKNIRFEKTPAGIRYVISKTGNGKKPVNGQKIKGHYAGKLLDGTPFDSSYERNEPFTFTYGVGDVIYGFDEGASLLDEGGKATIWIPSPLAYGNRDRSEVIKANSILVFELEILALESAEL